MEYKYMRIQGREIADNTFYANGVFGIFRDFEKKHVMIQEDLELYQEVVDFFSTKLPFPPMCDRREKVICFFKTNNSEEMVKYMNPLLWLLERYNHPYDVIYTNFPGTFVYEDEYQIVVKVDDLIYDKVDYIDKDIFDK